MSAHTAGAWEFAGGWIRTHFDGRKGGFSIARIEERNDDWEANARLIVSAPALLSAAREAIAEIAYWHADMLGDEAHPRGNGPRRVYDELVKAVADATGGAP